MATADAVEQRVEQNAGMAKDGLGNEGGSDRPTSQEVEKNRGVSAAPRSEPQWWLRTPEGLNYGPATPATLERWVREGRVTGDCQLCSDQDPNWRAAVLMFPALAEPVLPNATLSGNAGRPGNPGVSGMRSGPRTDLPVGTGAPSASGALVAPAGGGTSGTSAAAMVPHRGPLILTLALVGLLVQCPIFSVMAWVMGSSDLDEMARGRMDPSGASVTRAGRALGLLLSAFWIIMAVIGVGTLIFVAAVKAAP